MLLAPLMLILRATGQDPAAPVPPPQIAPAPERWETSLSTWWIEPPHEPGYLSAVISADRGPLHLEAHWAYEDRETFSLFAGRTFPIEGTFTGHVTPRLGVAAGNSDGIVPALGLEVSWKKLTYTSDIEYMIGTNDETEDFLYSWNELYWSVNERFTVGLVGQRTNIFDQHLTVDRGLLFGVNFGKTWLTAYLFNPDLGDPYYTIAIGAGF